MVWTTELYEGGGAHKFPPIPAKIFPFPSRPVPTGSLVQKSPLVSPLLSDVCLSVCLSRTERPRKTKIGTEVAHVTRDSDTTFKVKRSKANLLLMS